LSPSTAEKDRYVKFDLYRQAGVKYYLIADPGFQKVEIYQWEAGEYSLEPISDNHYLFQLPNGCQLDIPLETIWQ
jgi:Uma2 family endonuclease